MAYKFHYVFCATPYDATEELQALQQTLSEFNEAEAMPNGLLFASLLLVPTVRDKRPLQGAIDYNLRMCRYYIQVMEDSWGPPERDFERDWVFVNRCIADPELPMREAVMLFKAPLLPHKVDPAIVELKQNLLAGGGPHAAFDTISQLRTMLRPLFSRWLATVLSEATPETAGG